MAGNPLASLPGLPQRPSLARSSASETRLTQPGIEGERSRKLNSAPIAAFRFSVSAAIGFVGLFGIAVMEGIIILSYFNRLVDAGVERSAAVIRACQIRLRPVMMTS